MSTTFTIWQNAINHGTFQRACSQDAPINQTGLCHHHSYPTNLSLTAEAKQHVTFVQVHMYFPAASDSFRVLVGFKDFCVAGVPCVCCRDSAGEKGVTCLFSPILAVRIRPASSCVLISHAFLAVRILPASSCLLISPSVPAVRIRLASFCVSD